MNPVPLQAITQAIEDHYGRAGVPCPQSNRVVEQGTKFDRKEAKSKLQLVTFHDGAGRMLHEAYAPVDFDDSQIIAFAARLLPPSNPLKSKLQSCSVKRR